MKIESIISLADLITRQKIHQAKLVDEINDPTSKMSALYNGILDGKIKTDDDAINLIYDETGKLANLKKLKERLYERMLNSVFFIDQSGPNYVDIFVAGKTCYKNYGIIKLLLSNRKNEIGAELAEKTFKISKKYEFTDLNFLLSSSLCLYYLTFTRNQKKFNYYSEEKKYYLSALEAESVIEELYGSLNLNLSISGSGLTEELLDFYKSKIPFINEKLSTISTTKLILTSYLFFANIYLESKEYNLIIKIVDEGLSIFKSKGVKSMVADYTLRTRAGIANFLLKNYDEAEKLFLQNLTITEPSTTNWFYTYNLYFSLKIVVFDYKKSYEILSTVFHSKEFDRITHPLLIQLFKIKEAYIHFLIELGKIDPTQSIEAPLRKFRLNRFLNDVPTFSKDKRGVNISILIIQMLLLVQNKKHNEIIDKLDALNMYSHRYLRNDNAFRSNCFIRMLMKLPDADYHPVRWARYVKKFRGRLDEHPFELSYHNLDLEVIPFETLYDMVLEILVKK